jgi:predicted TIM-barrel fold metal-dependent hydrolase
MDGPDPVSRRKRMTGDGLDLSQVPIVDGHCHPLAADPWDVSPAEFLDLFTEARSGTMGDHLPHTGFLRRALRAFAARLRCEPTVAAVVEARRRIGRDDGHRIVAESRIAALLVDTGYPPTAMPLEAMRGALPCAVHEVWRIETCAQALLARDLPYDGFLAAFREELEAAAGRAVALKSIIAYRSGLAVAAWPRGESARAYAEVLGRVRAGGSPRLTHAPLLDTLFAIALDVCRASGRPLQLHCGFGDPDVDLLRANPLLLRPILEDPAWADVKLVVLHMAYPYVREAAFMAAVWPQLHVDLSLALPFLGAAAAPPLAEMLSLAPASKLLYGSDVRALPELFAFSAGWARAALGEALAWLVARGELDEAEALRIAAQVLGDNARALYRLPA